MGIKTRKQVPVEVRMHLELGLSRTEIAKKSRRIRKLGKKCGKLGENLEKNERIERG